MSSHCTPATLGFLGAVLLAFALPLQAEPSHHSSASRALIVPNSNASSRPVPTQPPEQLQSVESRNAESFVPPVITVHRVISPVRCGMRVIPMPSLPPSSTGVKRVDGSADPKFVVKTGTCGSPAASREREPVSRP
jgi:hypothetical protein